MYQVQLVSTGVLVLLLMSEVPGIYFRAASLMLLDAYSYLLPCHHNANELFYAVFGVQLLCQLQNEEWGVLGRVCGIILALGMTLSLLVPSTRT